MLFSLLKTLDLKRSKEQMIKKQQEQNVREKKQITRKNKELIIINSFISVCSAHRSFIRVILCIYFEMNAVWYRRRF